MLTVKPPTIATGVSKVGAAIVPVTGPAKLLEETVCEPAAFIAFTVAVTYFPRSEVVVT